MDRFDEKAVIREVDSQEHMKELTEKVTVELLKLSPANQLQCIAGVVKNIKNERMAEIETMGKKFDYLRSTMDTLEKWASE